METYPQPGLRATPAETAPKVDDDALLVAVDTAFLARVQAIARDSGWRCARLASEVDGNPRAGLIGLAHALGQLAEALERRLPRHAPSPDGRAPNSRQTA